MGWNFQLKEAVNPVKLVEVLTNNPTQGIWKGQQTWSFTCLATLSLQWN